MAVVVHPSTATAYVTKMSEKCKSTSPSAIQVKNRVKDNQYWREIRRNKVTLKKANELLTHAIKLDWLTVVYV